MKETKKKVTKKKVAKKVVKKTAKKKVVKKSKPAVKKTKEVVKKELNFEEKMVEIQKLMDKLDISFVGMFVCEKDGGMATKVRQMNLAYAMGCCETLKEQVKRKMFGSPMSELCELVEEMDKTEQESNPSGNSAK
jgi:hypothetical protein